MSVIGYGKVGEGLKVQSVDGSAVVRQFTGSANTVYYNGYSPTTGAVMFDAQDYDDLEIALLIGTVQGAGATVTNAIYESDTNNPMAATAVTGASFTSVTSASTAALQEANVHAADRKRYLCLVTNAQTHTSIPFTFPMAGMFIAGQSKAQAVSKTLVFDV